MRRAWLALILLSACLGGHAGRSAPGLEPAEPAAESGGAAPPEPAQGSDAAAPPAEEPAEAEAASPPAEEPPPLPVPEPPPPAADLADPLDLLWGHRLEFAPGGEPLVTIGLMEGQREIAFRPLATARISLRGGGVVEVPAGVRLSVRARSATPARFAWAAVLREGLVAGHEVMAAQRRAAEAAGVAVRLRVTGAVYGIAGRVVDNRREQLVVDGDGSESGARASIEALRARGLRGQLAEDVAERPSGVLVLSGPGGAPLGEGDSALAVTVEGEAGFVVEAVEHELGGAGRAREDRSYRGRLYVALDARGTLAAVHGVSLEELLRGIVPSEMPAGSPMEALKAQAVAARSNVLAQLGVRHPNDPFMLCAEVHCQAYRGDGARTPRTDEAVRATRGEAVFGQRDRRLINAVYSAMCGGHGEDNETVWNEAPSPSLRGHPDLPPEEAAGRPGGLAEEPALRAFLKAPSHAYCRLPLARRDRFRWERRLEPSRLRELGDQLGIGPVKGLRVLSRGVSGRARMLRVEGERGAAEVGPELRIRHLLGELPSAMFVVDRDGEALVLRGGGWGHGVGMCQWGAVGRAMSGQGHQEILRAYYAGAEVAKVY